MKKIALLAVLVASLAVPALAFAGGGNGGGLDAHLQKLSGHVATYVSKCHVAQPPAKCSDAKTRLSGHLDAFASRLQDRIAKVSARPASDKQAQRLSALQAALTQVQGLKAQL